MAKRAAAPTAGSDIPVSSNYPSLLLPKIPPSITRVAPVSSSLLVQRCLQLQSDLAELTDQLDKVRRSGNASDAARAYVAIHSLKKRMDALVGDGSILSKLVEQWKTRVVPSIFDEEGITSAPLDEGVRVGVSSKVMASVRSDAKYHAYQFLLDGEDTAPLVTQTVNASSLSSHAKGMLEDNRELPPDLFNTMVQPSTSVTWTKSK